MRSRVPRGCEEYLALIVDHRTRRFVSTSTRTGPADGREVPGSPQQEPAVERIALVSYDDAFLDYQPGEQRSPNTVSIYLDPFHIVESRRRRAGRDPPHHLERGARSSDKQLAKDLEAPGSALSKKPADLTDRQQHQLALIQELERADLQRSCSRTSCARSTGYHRSTPSSCSTSSLKSAPAITTRAVP